MDGIFPRSRENHLPSPFFSERVIAASLFLTNAAFSVFAFTFPLQSRAISIITAGINLVGAYVVFYRIFPPAPAPKEIPRSKIETTLDKLDELAIASIQKGYDMLIPFIERFSTPDPSISIPDLLKGLSGRKSSSIFAYQKTIACVVLLTFLLINEKEQPISKEQAASSLESVKRVYQEYVNYNKENGSLDQLNENWVTTQIRNLIPELIRHKLEQHVLEIVNIWSKKNTTIHEAPLDWFRTWLNSMIETYGEEKVKEELNLEAWTSRIRASSQPNFLLTKPSTQNSTSITWETAPDHALPLLEHTEYNANILIARNRLDDWSKIGIAAYALENEALNQEARKNQEAIRQYLEQHERSSDGFL